MINNYLRHIEMGDLKAAAEKVPQIESRELSQELLEQVLQTLDSGEEIPEGLQKIRETLREFPRCIGLYHCLVRMMIRQKDIENADYWWSISKKIDPHNGLLWLLGVQIALLQDDVESAEVRHVTAMRFLQEDDILALRIAARIDMGRACQLWGGGQHEKALFWMRRSLRHDASWAEPWEALSGYLRMLGCKERARWYAQEAQQRREARERV